MENMDQIRTFALNVLEVSASLLVFLVAFGHVGRFSCHTGTVLARMGGY